MMKREYKKPQFVVVTISMPQMICSSIKWTKGKADTSKEILSREFDDWDWDDDEDY